jgi:hypothetical protein
MLPSPPRSLLARKHERLALCDCPRQRNLNSSRASRVCARRPYECLEGTPTEPQPRRAAFPSPGGLSPARVRGKREDVPGGPVRGGREAHTLFIPRTPAGASGAGGEASPLHARSPGRGSAMFV